MKLTEEIYLNCGIWEPSSMLFIAVPGYFASSAWCESDEAYQGISGRKFKGITADDGKSWALDRQHIEDLMKTIILIDCYLTHVNHLELCLMKDL